MLSLDEIIRKDFVQFLKLKDSSVSERTIQRYLSDIRYYAENYIDTTIIIKEKGFSVFFKKPEIKNFLSQRRSSTARASLKNFVEMTHENKLIADALYIEVLEYLKSLKKTKVEEQMEFLSERQLLFIQSDLIQYKEKYPEYKLLLPLIIGLSYNFLFEQEHLIRLKWSDIDLEKQQIRNLRNTLDRRALEWLSIPDTIFSLFIVYRDLQKNIRKDATFLSFQDQPLKNGIVNSVLYTFKHKANKTNMDSSVDIQKIIRSRILKDLIETEGQATIDFIKILGLKRNTQLEHALEEFLLYEGSKQTSHRIH